MKPKEKTFDRTSYPSCATTRPQRDILCGSGVRSLKHGARWSLVADRGLFVGVPEDHFYPPLVDRSGTCFPRGGESGGNFDFEFFLPCGEDYTSIPSSTHHLIVKPGLVDLEYSER